MCFKAHCKYNNAVNNHERVMRLPGWQKQLYPSSWSTQIPCTHGDDSHSFKLCWHKGPEYPRRHLHLNWVKFPVHVAPFWHGIEVQGSVSSSHVFPVYPEHNNNKL